MSAGTFACIIAMRRRGRALEQITDLNGLARTDPALALAMAVFMFSMAGIPPLSGFFGKLYVFLAAVQGGMWTLAVIGVLTSVVGAFYYLRIVKVMYFDAPAAPFDPRAGLAVLRRCGDRRCSPRSSSSSRRPFVGAAAGSGARCCSDEARRPAADGLMPCCWSSTAATPTSCSPCTTARHGAASGASRTEAQRTSDEYARLAADAARSRRPQARATSPPR